MKRVWNSVFDMIARYLVLIVFGISNAAIFYFLFTAVTIYPVYFLLKIFFNPLLASNVILIHDIPIEIIGACIAGSAYYLLLILNLSTKGIALGKRMLVLLFSFSCLLIVNILRIFLLSLLLVSGTSFFDIAHKFFWYFGSIFLVVLIWFLSVRLFKIKEIPFYSDITSLLNHSGKKSKRKNIRKNKKHSRKH